MFLVNSQHSPREIAGTHELLEVSMMAWMENWTENCVKKKKNRLNANWLERIRKYTVITLGYNELFTDANDIGFVSSIFIVFCSPVSLWPLPSN